MPPLIVISGHPASGKTTVAERLANDLGTWPVISRDSIKESLFDRLGWQDRAWSQKLGQASWELWSWAIELLMKTHHPLIAESNFSGTQAGIHLRHLADHYAYACLEIHCVAPPDVLTQRFADRAMSGARHPGHQDHQNLEEFAERFQKPAMLSGICSDPILLPTENLSQAAYKDLVRRCRTIAH